MRLGQIEILSRIMMPLLIVQFLLGMFANLFVTFSTSTDPNPLAVVFTGGSPAPKLRAVVFLLRFLLMLLTFISRPILHLRSLIIIVSAGIPSFALAVF